MSSNNYDKTYLYVLVGDVTSVKFAFCQRLLDLVSTSMLQSVYIDGIKPNEWKDKYQAICKHYEFKADLKDDLIVFDSRNGRLIGNAEALEIEIEEKYNIKCDLSWEQLEAISEESKKNYVV